MIPESLAVAVALAVEREGGDMDDVDALLDVWERVLRRSGERADIVRREAVEMAARMGDGEEP